MMYKHFKCYFYAVYFMIFRIPEKFSLIWKKSCFHWKITVFVYIKLKDPLERIVWYIKLHFLLMRVMMCKLKSLHNYTKWKESFTISCIIMPTWFKEFRAVSGRAIVFGGQLWWKLRFCSQKSLRISNFTKKKVIIFIQMEPPGVLNEKILFHCFSIPFNCTTLNELSILK